MSGNTLKQTGSTENNLAYELADQNAITLILELPDLRRSGGQYLFQIINRTDRLVGIISPFANIVAA